MPDWDLGLGRGAHVCHLFDGYAEQKQILLPFIRNGLRTQEHCLFTICDRSPDDWYLELQAYGVDVAAELDKHALVVIEEEKVRPPGEFNAIRLARGLWGMLSGLLAEFSGVRLAREVPWLEDAALSVPDLCHMEAAGTLLFQSSDIRSLCQYDLNRHAPAVIHTALRTHPFVVFAGSLHANPFYEVPQILANEPGSFQSDADANTVTTMLGSFR